MREKMKQRSLTHIIPYDDRRGGEDERLLMRGEREQWGYKQEENEMGEFSPPEEQESLDLSSSGTDTLLLTYLRDIGTISLLNREQEKTLAEQIQRCQQRRDELLMASPVMLSLLLKQTVEQNRTETSSAAESSADGTLSASSRMKVERLRLAVTWWKPTCA